MFHIFIFQEFEKITGMEEEGNIISMSSKESSDAQLIHNEDTIESSDHNEVIILYVFKLAVGTRVISIFPCITTVTSYFL